MWVFTTLSVFIIFCLGIGLFGDTVLTERQEQGMVWRNMHRLLELISLLTGGGMVGSKKAGRGTERSGFSPGHLGSTMDSFWLEVTFGRSKGELSEAKGSSGEPKEVEEAMNSL